MQKIKILSLGFAPACASFLLDNPVAAQKVVENLGRGERAASIRLKSRARTAGNTTRQTVWVNVPLNRD